jgi:hypothetical protein
MRKLLLVLALMLAPAMAFGQTTLPWKSRGNGLLPVHITDRKPIAVIYDDIDGACGTGVGSQLSLAENQNIGRLWKTLKEQGQEVHFYNASYFGDNAGDYLWQHLGTQYSVALCIGFDATYGSACLSALKKFFCPDSTTAQIIHWSFGDRIRDLGSIAPGSLLGVGVTAPGASLQTNSAYTGHGDSTFCAFITPSGDSLFTDRFLAQRAAYAYPNQPYPNNVPLATINGSYAGGFITATAGGAFSGTMTPTTAKMLNGRVTWSGATGPIWVSAVSESASANRVTVSQMSFNGGPWEGLHFLGHGLDPLAREQRRPAFPPDVQRGRLGKVRRPVRHHPPRQHGVRLRRHSSDSRDGDGADCVAHVLADAARADALVAECC